MLHPNQGFITYCTDWITCDYEFVAKKRIGYCDAALRDGVVLLHVSRACWRRRMERVL